MRRTYPSGGRWLASMLDGKQPMGEMRYLRADGSFVWCLAVPSLTVDPEGRRLFVVQLIDITERREFERQLRHQADHDALTDMLSRRRFTELLEQEISRVGIRAPQPRC